MKNLTWDEMAATNSNKIERLADKELDSIGGGHLPPIPPFVHRAVHWWYTNRRKITAKIAWRQFTHHL